jgi:hypothetical protein
MTPVHPGRVLKRELEARRLSANALAIALPTPSGRVTDILQDGEQPLGAGRGRHDVLNPHGKLANPRPRRVPNGVCDGAHCSRDADLANALDAKLVDVGVVLVDEQRFERGNVGVHRNVIFAEVCIHDAAAAPIDGCLFVQREGHAPDHAAIELAAREPRVNDPSRREGADKARGRDRGRP